MNTEISSTEKAIQCAWCRCWNKEYVEGNVSPRPSENFAKGYECGLRDALAWRSVADEFPFPDDLVLVAFHRSYAPEIVEHDVARFDGEDWYTHDGSLIRPTHWMPIPELTTREGDYRGRE